MKAARVQAASGALFALFLALHLATTSSALAGIAAYDRVLALLRHVYRPALPIEIALIGAPALVHLACGVRAFVLRWRRRGERERSWRVRVHRLSGWVLASAILGHVFATRVLPALADGPAATGRADFSYLAYSLLNWPAFMKPYYLIFGAAGAIHLTIGLSLAVKILWPARVHTRRAIRAGVIAAAICGALVVGGVGAIIARAGSASRLRFPEFRAAYLRYVPFLRPRVGPGDCTD